ncbi:MAG: GNAT family N-acetyltransferase, partial [Candidatus Accumulibacter phosphatis]|nr:GNAT family N-acetyltransferase [Candidatus Accumulibacter phosphatis]
NIFTCWVGGAAMLEAQQIMAAQGMLSHESPEMAITVFLGVVSYRRNRRLLMQIPPSLAEGFSPDMEAARSALGEAMAAGAGQLSVRQARRLLQAYGLAVGEHPLAGSIDKAIACADAIGYPVDLALLLASGAEFPEGAAGLRSPAEIRIAARDLRRRVRTQQPGSRVGAYRLRPGAARSGAPALRLGVADDPVFGPVIFLGPALATGFRGGRLVVALPPLNLILAGDLVTRSGFAEGLPEEDRPALHAAVSNALVRLSQLLTDLDEVTGIDLDPLHAEASGVVVLGARIGVGQSAGRLGHRRFAVGPYPKELEQPVDWQGRRLLIRPIRPEDENMLGELLNSLAPEDSRMRFFNSIKSLPRARLARFSQIDYDREMALVAIERGNDGTGHALGEVRAVANPGSTFADFAIVVASAIKGQGLGKLLLQCLLGYCRSRGIAELRGETLDGNLRMQRLARSLGFTVTTGADRGTLDLSLSLNPPEKA